MIINDVHEGIQKFKKRKRIGRGTGSGLGKTSGRGHNGQRSRAGHSQHPTFQGGAMPMIRRIPKRGFNNKFALRVGEVNIADLEANFEAGEEVTPDSLREKALANYRYDVLKVLGKGEISKKLTVTAHRFSQSAREKIEKAGGSVVVLPPKKPVVKNKMKSATKS
ncbi:MAG: large subunit ribosomal protein L15 [Mariniblastus sp.]